MIGKLLLIIVAAFVIVWLLRGVLLTRKRDPAPPEKLPGDLVACAHCGVHLPRGDARSAAGLHYCSEEHWRLGPREHR
jgi:uncharacterized protein